MFTRAGRVATGWAAGMTSPGLDGRGGRLGTFLALLPYGSLARSSVRPVGCRNIGQVANMDGQWRPTRAQSGLPLGNHRRSVILCLLSDRGAGEYARAAGRRINPVHLYPDLHQLIVAAPAAADVEPSRPILPTCSPGWASPPAPSSPPRWPAAGSTPQRQQAADLGGSAR